MRRSYAVLWLCLVLVGGAAAGCVGAEPTTVPATATVAPATATATAVEEVPTATVLAATATATVVGKVPTATATVAAVTATPTAPAAAPTSTTTPTRAATPTEAAPAWVADGVIGPEEYPHVTEAAGVRFYWANDEQFLYGAVSAETGGWVSVGLDPEVQMQGANFILGYVQGGQTTIADMYGTQPTALHPPDEELGGTNDIVTFGGREEGGRTTIEFQIPLDSGDAYDKALRPGERYPVLLAMGLVDELLEYHAARGMSEITLD